MIRDVYIMSDGQPVSLYVTENTVVTKIDGLSAETADVSMTELASQDGAAAGTARRPYRQVDIFLWNRNASDNARHNIYRYFPVTKSVRLYVKTDDREWYADGIVCKNTADLDEKVTTITLKCPDPNLYSAEEQTTNFDSTVAKFTFPVGFLANRTLLGETSTLTENVVFYDGEIETGVTIRIHANGAITGLKINSAETLGKMEFDDDKIEKIIGSKIQQGDDIEICTSKGRKHCTIIHNGITYNAINAVNKYPEWFQLKPGDNIFSYEASTGIENIQMSFENTIAYAGV